MKKLLSALRGVLVALGLTVGASAAHATLIVSGDSNLLVNTLQDTTVDNSILFTNVLSGGSNVAILSSSLSFVAPTTNAFYNSLGGVTSNIVTGPVTSSMLAGVDLFLSSLPDHAFTSDEVAALSEFLSRGGTAFLLGDNQNALFTESNAAINSLVADLGGTMTIVGPDFDHGVHTTTDIVSDPLTAGVNVISYAAPSIVLGGNALVRGSAGQTFIAYENTPVSVPEPSTFSLLLWGSLLGIGFVRGRHIALWLRHRDSAAPGSH